MTTFLELLKTDSQAMEERAFGGWDETWPELRATKVEVAAHVICGEGTWGELTWRTEIAVGDGHFEDSTLPFIATLQLEGPNYELYHISLRVNHFMGLLGACSPLSDTLLPQELQALPTIKLVAPRGEFTRLTYSEFMRHTFRAWLKGEVGKLTLRPGTDQVPPDKEWNYEGSYGWEEDAYSTFSWGDFTLLMTECATSGFAVIVETLADNQHTYDENGWREPQARAYMQALLGLPPLEAELALSDLESVMDELLKRTEALR